MCVGLGGGCTASTGVRETLNAAARSEVLATSKRRRCSFVLDDEQDVGGKEGGDGGGGGLGGQFCGILSKSGATGYQGQQHL